MKDEGFSVLLYDRCQQGAVRLTKNKQVIDDCINGTCREVEFDCVDRAVIINGFAPKAEDVMMDAIEAMEQHGLPTDRVIYISPGTNPELTEWGVTQVGAHGGNGHLNYDDGRVIASYLTDIVSQTAGARTER